MSIDPGKERRLRIRDVRMQQERAREQARVIGGYTAVLETELSQARALAALADGTIAIAAAATRLCDRLQEHQALDMQALADLQRLVIEHRAALARDRAIRSTGASA
jgi:hypothetical protein